MGTSGRCLWTCCHRMSAGRRQGSVIRPDNSPGWQPRWSLERWSNGPDTMSRLPVHGSFCRHFYIVSNDVAGAQTGPGESTLLTWRPIRMAVEYECWSFRSRSRHPAALSSGAEKTFIVQSVMPQEGSNEKL